MLSSRSAAEVNLSEPTYPLKLLDNLCYLIKTEDLFKKYGRSLSTHFKLMIEYSASLESQVSTYQAFN